MVKVVSGVARSWEPSYTSSSMNRPPRVPRSFPPSRRATDRDPTGEEPTQRRFWSEFVSAVLVASAVLVGLGLAAWFGREDPGFWGYAVNGAVFIVGIVIFVVGIRGRRIEVVIVGLSLIVIGVLGVLGAPQCHGVSDGGVCSN